MLKFLEEQRVMNIGLKWYVKKMEAKIQGRKGKRVGKR
jgi:hypothetical protein